MSLREKVIVVTPSGPLHGELFVGKDGLPELFIPDRQIDNSQRFIRYLEQNQYRPATFPAAWRPMVDAFDERIDGPLLEAWREIARIQWQIAEAQREAEAEEPRDPDCIDLAKAEWEAKGER